MKSQIIRSQPDLALWLQTPAGQYWAQWESAQFDRVVSDVFGYHGLQLGLPQLACLRNSRIRHCWVAQDHVNGIDGKSGSPGLYANSVALPFSDQSLDLVVLPHTLELSLDPHATLREVERVLVPEGRVIISGFNPLSLWGQRHKRSKWYARLGMDNYFLPKEVDFIGYWRLRHFWGGVFFGGSQASAGNASVATCVETRQAQFCQCRSFGQFRQIQCADCHALSYR